MPARYSRFAFAAILAILAFCAMAALYISTPAGAGLANDSVAYIAGARSILQGKGYSDIWLDSTIEPITHYPPLLSLTLSIPGLVGIDPLRGARLLNIFLFGANTILAGLLGWRMSSSLAAGMWSAALFMLNASLLRVHVFALSEPLYLFLSLLAFLFFDFFYTQPVSRQWKKNVWLALAGLWTGLAFLTRYSALALLPTFVISLLLVGDRPATGTDKINWRSRLANLGFFLGGAAPVAAAWFLRNSLSASSATNRTFQFHPVTAENIQPGFYNISQFLMPFEPWRQALLKSGLLYWMLAIFGLILLIWLAYRTLTLFFQGLNGSSAFTPLTYTTCLYIFGYLGAVLFSMSFFDASTKFQPRILAPLYVAFILLLINFGTWLWRFAKKNGKAASSTGQAFVVILVLATLAGSFYETSHAVAEFKSAGQGYASWKWRDSLVMASLRDLPAGTAIYTNTPPAVYLVTGRASRILPTPIDPVDDQPRSDYEQNLAVMRADLMTGKAVLALFDTSELEETPALQDIQPIIADLKVIQKTQGDTLYGQP